MYMPLCGELLLKAELLDYRIIAALIILLEVAKMGATISDHLKKATTGMVILVVLLKVLS